MTEPKQPTITRWLGGMPNELSYALIVAAICWAADTTWRVRTMERDLATLREHLVPEEPERPRSAETHPPRVHRVYASTSNP